MQFRVLLFVLLFGCSMQAMENRSSQSNGSAPASPKKEYPITLESFLKDPANQRLDNWNAFVLNVHLKMATQKDKKVQQLYRNLLKINDAVIKTLEHAKNPEKWETRKKILQNFFQTHEIGIEPLHETINKAVKKINLKKSPELNKFATDLSQLVKDIRDAI